MHSLSPFQQTVLEQDEMFFQTFPDARSDRPPASLLPLHPAYSSLAQALDPCFLPLPSCPPPVPRSLSRHPPRHPRPCPSPYPRPKDPAWSPFSPNVAGTFVNVMGGSMGGPAVPPDLTGSRPGISHPFHGSHELTTVFLVSISGKRSPDKKPALACVFCRGRKIACGPPTKDGDGRSCKCVHIYCLFIFPLKGLYYPPANASVALSDVNTPQRADEACVKSL